jgi:DNA-binding transcriptional regulator LsrR (DeoR family)
MNAERLELLAQVASWYYECDLGQGEIGNRIGLSTSMVSRMLREAREQGLVEIRVRYPFRTNASMELNLRDEFELKQAWVLNESNLPNQENILQRRLGEIGARCLQDQLHEGVKIALGWGTTVHAVILAMPDIYVKGSLVIQISGAMDSGDPDIDGGQLIRMLSQKISGSPRFLHAPLIVEDKTIVNALTTHPTNGKTLDLVREAEVAMIGIGIPPQLQRIGYLSAGDTEHLYELGAVGDVVGYHLDAQGMPVDSPLNQRVVGVDLDTLKTIQTVIAVARGVQKVDAILAALRGRYIDILVTDTKTGRAVLDKK